MPYITADRRMKLDPNIEDLQKKLLDLGATDGDLNYVITRLVAFYFCNETRYHMISRVSGVLDNVKEEFYRRLANPYEASAMNRNGDIPEFKEVLNRTNYLKGGN